MGAQEHSSASSCSSADVPRGPAGSLAPAQLLQPSVTMHTLTEYLKTQAAVVGFNFTDCTRCCILSQWEWDLDFSPVCLLSCPQNKDCCWCEGSREAGAASHIPQTSLLPCSLNLFIWLGHSSPTSLHCRGCSRLLHWLLFPSQGKCISPSFFPSLLCMFICQLCQTQKRIFDCSNILMREECSVIPLSNTSCVLITQGN